MAADSDAGDTANDDEEPTTERTETVEVDLVPADVERIEFELEQTDTEHSVETVEEYIEHAVRMRFAWIDSRTDLIRVEPRVDVPPVTARRAELEAERARQRGEDASVGEYLLESVSFHPAWYADGEPIESDETDE